VHIIDLSHTKAVEGDTNSSIPTEVTPLSSTQTNQPDKHSHFRPAASTRRHNFMNYSTRRRFAVQSILDFFSPVLAAGQVCSHPVWPTPSSNQSHTLDTYNNHRRDIHLATQYDKERKTSQNQREGSRSLATKDNKKKRTRTYV
jgi:hypothetical protein